MGKHLFGTSDDDGLDGANGDDVIVGYAGNDTLSGGNGNDVLIGDGLLPARVALVSMDGNGVSGDDGSVNAHFSADGTKVIFQSIADNFIPGDDVGVDDVFIKDLVTGALTAVSTRIPEGQEDGDVILLDGDSYDASLSGDGKYALFTTTADNLIDIDNEGVAKIVMRNLATGQYTLVSQAKNGTTANDDSAHASFSADSSKVIFETHANDLLAMDGNGFNDILLKTLSTGTLRVVSTNEDGDIANGDSHNASLSGNGQLAAFESDATNLSAADNNGLTDVYVKNLVTDAVTLVSASKTGIVGNAASTGIGFSADGTKAVFSSDATNLVAHDSNGHSDIFIKDLASGAIRLISTDDAGQQGNGNSFGGVLSPDGTELAFISDASNLVAGDTNGVTDVFVKDLVGGDIVRVSIGNAGMEGDGASSHISWSPDGTHLLFESHADNLTGDLAGSTNVFVATIDFPTGGDDVLDGGVGNDTFLPGAGHDTIRGDDGDDVALFHGDFDGGDAFDGGAGNDTLVLEGGYASAITFGSGVTGLERVQLVGQHNYNLVAGAGSFDPAATIVVDNSAGDAVHSLQFDGSAAHAKTLMFEAGAGNDVLKGAIGSTTFDMRAGGDDAVVGGTGQNLFLFGDTFTAADKITGAGGTLSLDGDYSSNMSISGATILDVSKIMLGAGHDYAFTLVGDLGTTQMTIDASGLGIGHSLRINAGAQTDLDLTLTGAAGNDVLTTGGGDDTIDLTSGGNDRVSAGGGGDFLRYDVFTAQDTLNAGAGSDAVFLNGITGLRGATLALTGANFAGVENLTLLDAGHAFNFTTADAVVAAGQSFSINGSGIVSTAIHFDGSAETDGSFYVMGGAKGDTLTGGANNDTFDLSGGGADIVNGGGGNDTFMFYQTSLLYPSGVPLAPATQLNGGSGNDVLELYGAFKLLPAQLVSIEKIVVVIQAGITMVDADVAAGKQFTIDATGGSLSFDGSAETDGSFKIALAGKDNTVKGGALADIVNAATEQGDSAYSGGGGADTITGGLFRDTIHGDAGNDLIVGGGGNDTLTGGAGADTFRYNGLTDADVFQDNSGPEHITDFDMAADKIDLTFAIAGTNATQHISFLNFSGVAQGVLEDDLTHLTAHHAELIVIADGDMKGTYLAIDNDGVAGFDRFHDMFINVTGATHTSSFSSADFI